VCVVKLESDAGSLSRNDSIYVEKHLDAPSIKIYSAAHGMLRDQRLGNFSTDMSIKIYINIHIQLKRRQTSVRLDLASLLAHVKTLPNSYIVTGIKIYH